MRRVELNLANAGLSMTKLAFLVVSECVDVVVREEASVVLSS